ncbi:unnamed protein product [Symbiodinium pilosum]|uniref:F5/8 type C domain-containing protein n=1 Tax=Symbiodinium pilosum TaxID=2952 RepID=A0A812U7D3_SYMPI|nr:unnamed protein product [Symbiodinium pilosum]
MLQRLAAVLGICAAEAAEEAHAATQLTGPSSGCGSHRRCTSLEPGEWLAPGEWLTSPSDGYVAVLQADQLEVLETDLRSLFDPVACTRSVKVRFTVTATRGGGDERLPQGVQLSEFLLWRAGGKPVQPTASNVACTAGVGPPYQGPRNAVDGNLRTKWWVSSEPNVTLAMDFSHLPHDGPFLFGFTTGDDMPSRDPVQWLLEASVDGFSWVELHRQDTAFATPTSRFSMTQLFDVTQKWGQLLCPKCALDGQRQDQTTREPVAMVLTDLGALTLKPRSSFPSRVPIQNESPGMAIC